MARTRPATSPKPAGRSPLVWWIGGSVLVVGAVAALLLLRRGDRQEVHVDWPESRPTGEPVVVGRALRPGDAFTTVIETKARIVLEADFTELGRGMTVDAKLEVAHDVAAREGGGTRSTLRWKALDVNSNVPNRQAQLWSFFGERENPYVVVQERDAAGARLPAPPVGGAKAILQGLALDLLLSGFVDPTLDFLPAGRAVRVGETWKLFDDVGPFPGIDRTVRTATDTEGEGFPVLARAGVVRAEAVEDHAGEKTLRLRVLFTVTSEGDTRPPALAGHLSLGGKGEGTVWVSLATGLPVETTFVTTLKSKLTKEGRNPAERAIRQTVVSTTVRRSPEGG